MGSEVNPAVVLGLSPTGLGIIRALSRKGIRVIGIDRNPWAIGNFTRYGDRKIILSEHNWEESLLKLLLEISKNYNEKPVLFCAEDLFLAFTAKFANHLKNSYLMPNSFNHNTIDLFLNKERFYRTCLDAGIETPNTYFPKNEEDIIEISNEVQYPCIIKPTYSHLWRRKLRGNKVVEVQSSRDLLFKYKLMTSLGDGLMVQEVIPGLDNCIHLCEGYFDQNSEPLAIFTGRKIRQFPPITDPHLLPRVYGSPKLPI